MCRGAVNILTGPDGRVTTVAIPVFGHRFRSDRSHFQNHTWRTRECPEAAICSKRFSVGTTLVLGLSSFLSSGVEVVTGLDVMDGRKVDVGSVHLWRPATQCHDSCHPIKTVFFSCQERGIHLRATSTVSKELFFFVEHGIRRGWLRSRERICSPLRHPRNSSTLCLPLSTRGLRVCTSLMGWCVLSILFVAAISFGGWGSEILLVWWRLSHREPQRAPSSPGYRRTFNGKSKFQSPAWNLLKYDPSRVETSWLTGDTPHASILVLNIRYKDRRVC